MPISFIYLANFGTIHLTLRVILWFVNIKKSFSHILYNSFQSKVEYELGSLLSEGWFDCSIYTFSIIYASIILAQNWVSRHSTASKLIKVDMRYILWKKSCPNTHLSPDSWHPRKNLLTSAALWLVISSDWNSRLHEKSHDFLGPVGGVSSGINYWRVTRYHCSYFCG